LIAFPLVETHNADGTLGELRPVIEVDDGDAYVDFQQRALAAVRLAEAKGAGA
jgi:hypothetical protein